MGAYCTRALIPHHTAKVGEIMTVRRLSSYYDDAALFGDNHEIACIPHKGCLLEIVGTAATSHPQVNLLLPGQVIRYKRSFFFGDRFELSSGVKVGLEQFVGFRLQLAPRLPAAPAAEETIIAEAARDKPESVTHDRNHQAITHDSVCTRS